MKLEIKEIDGVPVTGPPGRFRTVNDLGVAEEKENFFFHFYGFSDFFLLEDFSEQFPPKRGFWNFFTIFWCMKGIRGNILNYFPLSRYFCVTLPRALMVVPLSYIQWIIESTLSRWKGQNHSNNCNPYHMKISCSLSCLSTKWYRTKNVWLIF